MNLELQQAFFNDQQARFSSETVRSYKISLVQFFTYCPKNEDEVQAKDVRNWMASMEEKGLKPRTIQLKLSALKSFYHYLMEENILLKNPMTRVRTPQKEDCLPYYLNKKQIVQLQELTKGNPRNRAIVETLYVTGVRISELLNIKLTDIKWNSRQIWIRKGKGNKERFVLFTYECSERLKAYLSSGVRRSDSPYLFASPKGGPLSRCLVELLFRQYSKELGFRVTPHTLRHTFAAYLSEKGMEFGYIQELLGHANLNSTRIYTRLTNQSRKNQYDRYQT